MPPPHNIPFQCCCCWGKNCQARSECWSLKFTNHNCISKSGKATPYLFPTSSPVTMCPSTMVNAPIPERHIETSIRLLWLHCPTWCVVTITLPGRTRFFSISVPVAVALMRQTCAFSRASWPWSPHSLKTNQHTVWSDNELVSDGSASFLEVYIHTVAALTQNSEQKQSQCPN